MPGRPATTPVASPRSYADPCGVARALDAVGERWALLVVRELSLGPRRFGQLRTGLPDISPNVLSQRLRELEDAGVVARYELPAPAATVVYDLTDDGRALDPVLQALGRWGATRPAAPTTRAMSAVSFVRSLRALLGPTVVDRRFGLVIDDEPFAVDVAHGEALVTRGDAPPDAVTLTGDVASVSAVLVDGAEPSHLEREGRLRIAGDRRAARRLAGSFRRPARVSR